MMDFKGQSSAKSWCSSDRMREGSEEKRKRQTSTFAEVLCKNNSSQSESDARGRVALRAGEVGRNVDVAFPTGNLDV